MKEAASVIRTRVLAIQDDQQDERQDGSAGIEQMLVYERSSGLSW